MKLVSIAVALLTLPLVAAPQVPNAGHPSEATAAIRGEVQAFDFFEQTFLIRLDDGNVETIPFSRFTDFFRKSGSKGHVRRETIDPTEVTVGDRLHIQLDPNEATAAAIEVLPAPTLSARTTIGDARRPQR